MESSSPCKVCEHRHMKVVGVPRSSSRFPRADQHRYRIVQCNCCGFYSLQPELDLTQAEWESLYKSDYFAEANVTPWQLKIHEQERKERLDLIEQCTDTLKGRFLDYGCGEGWVLQEAMARGWDTYGQDIADNLDTSVDRKCLHFAKGSILETHYPDGYFSAIYMDSVLEHVTHPIAILRELFRVLVPGGVLLLIVPNEDCLENTVKGLVYALLGRSEQFGCIKPFVPPFHIQGFNGKSLKSAIAHSGFQMQRMLQFGGDYPFWKAYGFLSGPFLRQICLYPFGLLSIVVNRQAQLMAIAKK